MARYVATFHTHLAALRSCGALKAAGCASAKLAPVPRALSSSCGTCVFYEGGEPMWGCMDRDWEATYTWDGGGYTPLSRETNP